MSNDLPITKAKTAGRSVKIDGESQEGQGVPARWGDPARGIPTPKPPTVRENHEQGPPLEPGPLAPCPLPKRCRGGGRSVTGSKGGRGPGSKGGFLRPVRGQEAWEYHELGPPNEPGPLAFSQKDSENR